MSPPPPFNSHDSLSPGAHAVPSQVDLCSPVVSLPDELLVQVDAADQPLGTVRKQACHQQPGQLHRAFSLFVARQDGAVLLQQRSASKPLWPKVWANSCCSHPREGEELSAAVRRRALEELGLDIEPRWLFTFRYYAAYQEVGCEHELCSVWFATSDAPPKPNPREVADFLYIEPKQLTFELNQHPERYSPWLRLEWPLVWWGHGQQCFVRS